MKNLDTEIEELTKQRDALNAKIEELLEKKRKTSIARVLALMGELNLTSKDLSDVPSEVKKVKAQTTKTKLPPMYIDPESKETWSGKGRPPAWYDKNNKAKFLIKQETNNDIETSPIQPIET